MRMWCTTHGSMDPLVMAKGEAYRITPVGNSRYMVTRKRDGVRIGFFWLDAKKPWRVEVLPIPDDPSATDLVSEVGRETLRAELNGWA